MSTDTLLRQQLICVAIIDNPNDAVHLTEALLAGGLNTIEVTFRTVGAADAIARIRQVLPEAIVGAGTLLTSDQVKQAVDAGAQFGVRVQALFSSRRVPSTAEAAAWAVEIAAGLLQHMGRVQMKGGDIMCGYRLLTSLCVLLRETPGGAVQIPLEACDAAGMLLRVAVAAGAVDVAAAVGAGEMAAMAQLAAELLQAACPASEAHAQHAACGDAPAALVRVSGGAAFCSTSLALIGSTARL